MTMDEQTAAEPQLDAGDAPDPADEAPDRLGVAIAVLIAVATLVGGLIGWRAAVIGGDASGADASGLSATLNAAQTRMLSDATFYRHYRAYSSYAIDQTLQQGQSDPSFAIGADTSRLFFPARYLNRDGSYAGDHEQAEAWAAAEQNLDLDADDDFAAAAVLWSKTRWMIGLLVVATVALLCYTLAESLHASRARLRYAVVALGTLALIAAGAGAVLIEWVG